MSRAISADDRLETRVLVLALALVIGFFFLALYLGQSEISDLRDELRTQVETTASAGLASVRETLADCGLDELPGQHARLRTWLDEQEKSERSREVALSRELRRHLRRLEASRHEALRVKETHLAEIKGLLRDLYHEQLVARRAVEQTLEAVKYHEPPQVAQVADINYSKHSKYTKYRRPAKRSEETERSSLAGTLPTFLPAAPVSAGTKAP